MAIANIIAAGIGFNPGSVKFIPTRGFGAAVVEEVFSGGFPDVYRYRPRIRFKFKDEEEKKAAEIIENIIEVQPIDTTDEELELILRLRLQYHEITFKLLYMNWLEQEFDRIEKLRKKERKKLKKRHEEDVIIMLLH